MATPLNRSKDNPWLLNIDMPPLTETVGLYGPEHLARISRMRAK